MPRTTVTTAHCPFDRLWQPGAPFRPRRSRPRRWCMASLLLFLAASLSAYWFLTDPTRVRAMAQTYLSNLAGGPVRVGSASLSLTRGLRLSHVTVSVDDGANRPDDTLFSADVIDVQYDAAALLRGELIATRIVATGPQVNLVEEAGNGRWNYQRLHRRPPASTGPAGRRSRGPQMLPEIVLRDATVSYAELDGKRLVPRGQLDVEGRFTPAADGREYGFELQSRGAFEGVGPVVSGAVQLTGADAGTVTAALAHFRFDRDVEAMLPAKVRDFWVAHEFRGSLDIPEFRFTPAADGRPQSFRLRTTLSGVEMRVRPEELGGPAGRPPVAVADVSGAYTFDDAGITVEGLRGTIAGVTLAGSGRHDGYAADSPLHLRIGTPADAPLDLPPTPPVVLESLPKAARDVYEQLKPSGRARLSVAVDRPARSPGGPLPTPTVKAELTILDGSFQAVFFPYPIRHATGLVTVTVDPAKGEERVVLSDVQGVGPEAGPNAGTTIHLDGWVGPFSPEVGCGIHARATGLAAEPALFAALPPAVRRAFTLFRGTGGEPLPRFVGDVVADVEMPVGLNTKAVVSADVTLTDGAGRLAAFPYPLEHLGGKLAVRDGSIELLGMTLHRGDASLAVNGRVTWPKVADPAPADAPGAIRPDLTLVARNVPVDDALLDVLPPAAKAAIRDGAATGLLDVDAHVFAKDVSPAADAKPDAMAAVTYDATVTLHDGTARPHGGAFALVDVGGRFGLHPDRLDLTDLHGRRDAGTVAVRGRVDWADAAKPADVTLVGEARGLTLDRPLYDLLPPSARKTWDDLSPAGAIDADVTYHGVAPCPTASTRPAATTAPTTAPAEPIDYRLTLRPTGVTVTPRSIPYRLDGCVGTIVADPSGVTLTDVRGTHGGATVAVGGRTVDGDANHWLVALSARGLTPDKDLLAAVPPALRKQIAGLGLGGTYAVDVHRLEYRGSDDPKRPGDVTIDVTASTTDGSATVGVPVEKLSGGIHVEAAVRDGQVASITGRLGVEEMQLAERSVTHLRAALSKPAGADVLALTDLRADLAGGTVGGRVDLRFPDDGRNGYAIDLAVKDADLGDVARQVAPKGGAGVKGQVTASLRLSGEWADTGTRRGAGDVRVGGKDMYQIPLLLGLMDVTNLALPTTEPFSDGSAKYTIDGKRVTFESLQMRSDTLVMSGSGSLDFGTKQVRMNFTTDNPNLPKVPLIGDLVRGAKQELLQIQVRGTVQDPTVSAASLHTFTTTVDEVLHGAGTGK